MSLTVKEVTIANKEEYERYIFSRGDTTFVDTWAWREVVEEVYKLPQFWFIARNRDKIEGILALTLSNHPIFGRYLASAPFGNQGGFYVDSDFAFQALLHKAKELQNNLKARYTIIRHSDNKINPPNGWQQDPLYTTYYLPLNSDPNIFFKEHLRAKRRSQVSKSMKYGFKVIFGQLELLDDFWYIISYSMKELGSPYHSKHYLETLLKKHESKSELSIVYTHDNKPVGASLLMYHQKTVIQLHANFLLKYRSMCAGDFLYWSVIAECCRRGFKWLDMGRSLIGSGNEHFKMKWRPTRHQLFYWYRLSPGTHMPNLNPENPRFRQVIWLWRHMPLWLTRLAGPRLISGIL